MHRYFKKNMVLYLASFFISAIIMTMILALLDIYPFGRISILCRDLNIQYFDFFKYFRNCLYGKDSLIYTFHKSLGGTMFGVYAYYLSSPFNLLLFFFKDVQLFIVVSMVLKIALSSCTLSIYLRNRFEHLHPTYILALSAGFALGNYNLLQLDNIMWLDGVYMLPLLLLCVYRFAHGGSGVHLSVCTGIMILFCWYISYMIWLFAVLYYLYEAFLSNRLHGWKCRLRHFLTFCFYEGSGVCLGGVFLIPVIVEVLKGKGARSENIFLFTSNFSWVDVFKGFLHSKDSVISLFCGTFVIIAVTAYFICKKIPWKSKALSGLFLFIMVLSMRIKALENIWNGFRFASFYCRFGMLGIFVLILIAASLLNEVRMREDYSVLLAAASVCLCFILLAAASMGLEKKVIVISSGFAAGYLVIFAMMRWHFRQTAAVFLALAVSLMEMLMYGQAYLQGRFMKGASKYLAYEKEQEALTDQIYSRDHTFFRMDETKHREDYKSKTTSFYNESLAYGYKSLSHYSSVYDASLSRFMLNSGYYYYLDFIAYDEPILAIDSLLGLKYLMSDKAHDGYSYRFSGTQKDVYENSYALPLAYGVAKQATDDFGTDNLNSIEDYYVKRYTRNDNPFLFQNKVYSAILGREVELYEPVLYEAEIGKKKAKTTIALEKRTDRVLYYGWMDEDKRRGTQDIVIDGEKKCRYSFWNCFSVFCIGSSDQEHMIRMKNYRLENKEDLVIYALNLELFEKVAQELKENSAKTEQASHNRLNIEYSAKEDGHLMLTVPYDECWEIVQNGTKVKPDQALGAFMSIPVKKGENKISMRYRYPYLAVGLIFSIGGCILLGVASRIKKWRARSELVVDNRTRI